MTETNDSNYVLEHLPSDIVERLESGAFQSLCSHLRERSDQVQNIDLMTVSGFCRNCLAKVRRYCRNFSLDNVMHSRLSHLSLYSGWW
jgi:hypothetical protein